MVVGLMIGGIIVVLPFFLLFLLGVSRGCFVDNSGVSH